MNRPPIDPNPVQASALAGELHVLVGKLKRRLREQARMGDLTSSQVSVLIRLELEGPATVTALAQATGMRPQSMGANVATLVAAGLVCGSPDPNDGRQTLWSITAACRKKIKAGRAAREDWLSRTIQTHLTAGEQKKLAEAIELLKRLADAPAP